MRSLPQSFNCGSTARLRREDWNHSWRGALDENPPTRRASECTSRWVMGLEHDLNFCVWNMKWNDVICVFKTNSSIVEIPGLAGPKSQLHQMFCFLPLASNHLAMWHCLPEALQDVPQMWRFSALPQPCRPWPFSFNPTCFPSSPTVHFENFLT